MAKDLEQRLLSLENTESEFSHDGHRDSHTGDFFVLRSTSVAFRLSPFIGLLQKGTASNGPSETPATILGDRRSCHPTTGLTETKRAKHLGS